MKNRIRKYLEETDDGDRAAERELMTADELIEEINRGLAEQKLREANRETTREILATLVAGAVMVAITGAGIGLFVGSAVLSYRWFVGE